jgi:hypothetical protein
LYGKGRGNKGMTLYVYPQVFRWGDIVPKDYPFVHILGEGIGVLLVFDSKEKYDAYSNGDGRQPILIKEETRDGQK